MQGPEAFVISPFRWFAVICAALVVLTAGCGSLGNSPSSLATTVSPYKVEIVQGNVVSREQVAVLQPGMTRAQVREILGTPLLASVFHADRWDYIFTLRRQGVESPIRKLTVFFKGDLLDRTEGEQMPTEAEFVSQIDTRRSLGKVPPLEVSEDVLKDFSLKNRSAPPVNRASAADLPAVPVIYPPLEGPGGSLPGSPAK
jgi:outer membrane protein assembly factor BamE